MFAVVYYFKVKEGRNQDLIDSWTELTKLIYSNRGSLGSRLHQKSDNEFVAYAQWPNRNTWNPPEKPQLPGGEKWANLMDDACAEIKTEHELEMVVDLLKDEPNN